jgi:hypothetical protein
MQLRTNKNFFAIQDEDIDEYYDDVSFRKFHLNDVYNEAGKYIIPILLK